MFFFFLYCLYPSHPSYLLRPGLGDKRFSFFTLSPCRFGSADRFRRSRPPRAVSVLCAGSRGRLFLDVVLCMRLC
jgi:hypothetical protein